VSAFVDLALAAWVLLEAGVRVRESIQGKGRREHDRATRVLIALALAAAIAGALLARSQAPSLRLPTAAETIGAIVMWLGLALRAWAIAALGRSFRTTIEVDPDQAVVATGPYRWVRHPSYTGLLLIVAGFGLSTANWLSFAACVALPLPAIVRRIQLEEAELNRTLGEAYSTYESDKARLIPKLW
jgi:protein-S-isoprenylcysteine O-methyltransferase Ste14